MVQNTVLASLRWSNLTVDALTVAFQHKANAILERGARIRELQPNGDGDGSTDHQYIINPINHMLSANIKY